MSAEVAPIKKRGRPPKKAVSSVDDNNAIVEMDAVSAPLQQQKSRGKAIGGSGNGAKKSSTSTITSTKGEVEPAVSSSKSTASSTTRKRAVKSSSTASISEENEAPRPTTRTRAAKAEPKVVKEKTKTASEKTTSAKTPAQTKKQQVAQVTQAPIPTQELEGAQASEILQQARAFAKSSQEPRKSTHSQAELSSIETAQEQSNPRPTEIAQTPTMSQTATSTSSTSSSSSPSSTPSHLYNPLLGSPRPKYALPYSTTAALASRQQSQQEQTQNPSWQRTRPSPGKPRRPLPPSPVPQPKKPTEMAYSELKRDPKFRELNSRWTRLIVALPIAIVTTYYLYQRRDEQRLYEESLLQHLPSRLTGGAGESSSAPSNADPGQKER